MTTAPIYSCRNGTLSNDAGGIVCYKCVTDLAVRTRLKLTFSNKAPQISFGRTAFMLSGFTATEYSLTIQVLKESRYVL
jgi:hypothetical protein